MNDLKVRFLVKQMRLEDNVSNAELQTRSKSAAPAGIEKSFLAIARSIDVEEKFKEKCHDVNASLSYSNEEDRIESG